MLPNFTLETEVYTNSNTVMKSFVLVYSCCLL